jgi:hypothetical protein
MEEQPPAPTESNSSSSSSSSAGAKKSILKKTTRAEGAKKTLQFTQDTQEHTDKPITKSSDASKQEYLKEISQIEREQKAQAPTISEEEALQKLISFAQTSIPEVEQIIASCAQDFFQIWNFFSTIPTSREQAKENFTKLRNAMKDYENNLVPITNRRTGQESDPLIIGYESMLDDLKRQAFYEIGSNPSVEKINDLISDYMESIMQKATDLYTQSKKENLEALFSAIDSNLPAKDQYVRAIEIGHKFLDDASKTEDKVHEAMRRYNVRGYIKQDYLAQHYSKATVEKNMIIDRALPFAQKVGVSKQILTYVF